MEILKKFFEKIISQSSDRIGVYITTDSQMEVVLYNLDTGEVKNSEKTAVEYNQIQREIDLDSFEKALIPLISKMDVPPSCPVCITLPNILTSIKAFPSDLESVELEVAIGSEAEKSYIFKKTEPKVSWFSIEKNNENLTETYLYSVIQKKQADEIANICKRNNLNLISIDVSFSSLLRGLAVSSVVDENIESHLKWCVMTISANNYIIAKFEGAKLLNIIENPLALRSIEQDVLYPTLNATITEKLQHEKLNNLYIVSQTEGFEAKKLAEHTKIMCNIHTIDDNKFNGNPLFINAIPAMPPVSLESVGAACWNRSKLDINLNFSESENHNELQGILDVLGVKKPIHLYLLGGVVLTGLLTVVISLMLLVVNNFLTSQIDKHSNEINDLKKLNVTSAKEFDVKEVMTSSYNRNLELLTSFDSIGAVIPEKLWIESFFFDNDLRVKIKGSAYKVEDIITYFENLRKMAKFKNLKIKNILIVDKGNNPTNISNETSFSGENDSIMGLPAPPMPENASARNRNYYEFVFDNYKEDAEKESLIDSLPGFVKNTIFGK